MQKNKLLNDLEFDSKRVTLRSTPQYITIGAHYKCNAYCKFCLGGDYPEFTLKVYKSFFEKNLYDILKKAEHVGFCGYGEVLLMPDILNFLDYINQTLPDTTKVFTTNGTPLTPEIRERLTEGKYSVLISLHAANKELHKAILKINAFDKIINNIKKLIKLKIKNPPMAHINLIFLVTSRNIHNLPDFIRLAADLGVDRVTCNYLTIFAVEHIKLSCYFNKERTNDIFDEALELAKESGITLVLPPKFCSKGTGDDAICRDPWDFFYVETQGSVLPCCFAGDHIGYLNKQDFEEIWNSDGYLRLRNGLIKGVPYEWCKYCYKYNASNIDDIRAHITFRPDTQKEIVEYFKKYKDGQR